MTNSLKSLKHDLWMILGCYSFALPLFRAYQITVSKGIDVVDRNTEIVIEGYPRSANTFAVVAFQFAQKRTVRIAHHVHGPAQIKKAVRNNIPAVMLIREPLEAISSLLVRQPFLSPQNALRNYIRFYRLLKPVRNEVVIAPFDQVIHHFDTIIEHVNTKWKKNFNIYDPTPDNMQKCFALVEEMDRRDRKCNEVNESTVGRPSSKRDIIKGQIQDQLQQAPLDVLLSEAIQLYKYFIQEA